jgi:hypothetical protein
MLTLFKERRPRQLLAVYVEQQRIEILRAHRQWRAWQIDSVEHFEVPAAESLYDYFQRLNFRPRGKKPTTLLLFLPLTFYNFHKEHYPAGLQDQLHEALNFDWQENIFLEHERMLNFPGPAVALNHDLLVPIFSLQRDVFDKFHQVLGAANFQNFRIIPSGLAYRAFLACGPSQPETPEIEVFARIVDPSHFEVHRFYKGQFLDSMLISKDRDGMLVFLEHLRAIGDGLGGQISPIHLICTTGETLKAEAFQRSFSDEVNFEVEPLQDSLISSWVAYLFEQDLIQTFDANLLLKPWQIPRIAWPLLALIGLYLIFTLYSVHTHRQLQETSRRLKKEIAQLEVQWKPIEQLQTRIAKFQEDQKTLSEFNREGYPLLEILTLLSQTTPEDTWLNYFSIRKGQIILRGDSKSAIKYLPELSKVEGFGDVRFASPVTRSPSSDDERFNVQLQVDTEKLRKTLDAMGLNKGEEGIEPSPSDQSSTTPELFESEQPTSAPTEETEVTEEETEVTEEEVTEEQALGADNRSKTAQ